MAERRAIPRRLRFEVLERDGFACRYCGGRAPDVRLELDHIRPLAGGGSDARDNLVTACLACNRGKAAVPLSSMPPGIEDAEARLRRLEAATGAVADELWPGAPRARLAQSRQGRAWLGAIALFTRRLSLHEVRSAARLACRRVPRGRQRRFLYFSKVCWNRIRERTPHD